LAHIGQDSQAQGCAIYRVGIVLRRLLKIGEGGWIVARIQRLFARFVLARGLEGTASTRREQSTQRESYQVYRFHNYLLFEIRSCLTSLIVSSSSFQHCLFPRHSSLATFCARLPTLGNNLREPRDGNRRLCEFATRTLGQGRARREFEGQRSARSYVSGYRLIKSFTGVVFAGMELISP